MTTQAPPRRRFALQKVQPGDYLLLGNDGKTLWRLAKYEDGPTHGLLDWDRDRTFWGLWKYREILHPDIDPNDLYEWENWSMEGNADTRAEVIADALRQS